MQLERLIAQPRSRSSQPPRMAVQPERSLKKPKRSAVQPQSRPIQPESRPEEWRRKPSQPESRSNQPQRRAKKSERRPRESQSFGVTALELKDLQRFCVFWLRQHPARVSWPCRILDRRSPLALTVAAGLFQCGRPSVERAAGLGDPRRARRICCCSFDRNFRVPLKYRDDNEARAAIRSAARDAGINSDRIGVATFTGISGILDDRVQIYFPIGSPNGQHHAEGTYDDILAAIRESTSFDDLFTNCVQRDLIYLPTSS